MSLSKELEKLKYDKRLIGWYVSRGKMTKDEQKKYLDSLPDLASNVDHFGLGGGHDNDDAILTSSGSHGQSSSGQY